MNRTQVGQACCMAGRPCTSTPLLSSVCSILVRAGFWQIQQTNDESKASMVCRPNASTPSSVLGVLADWKRANNESKASLACRLCLEASSVLLIGCPGSEPTMNRRQANLSLSNRSSIVVVKRVRSWTSDLDAIESVRRGSRLWLGAADGIDRLDTYEGRIMVAF